MRRGQAALEFLTTYGWALLIILVMIGALAYFGVLNPYNLLPEKCIAGSGFSCVESAAQVTGNRVLMRVSNNLGSDIKSVQLTSTLASGRCGAWSANPNVLQAGQIWPANSIVEFSSANCNPAVASGERIKDQFVISYVPVGKQYVKTSSGELLVKS